MAGRLLICEQLLACPDRLLSSASLPQNLQLYNWHVIYVMKSVLAYGVCQPKEVFSRQTPLSAFISQNIRDSIKLYRGADKSLARPGSKQATVTKLCKSLKKKKKFRSLYVQPGLRGSNDLRVGRKMATFQLFFQSGRTKDLSAPL